MRPGPKGGSPLRKSRSTSAIQIEGSLPIREFDNLYGRLRSQRPDVKAYMKEYNRKYRETHKEELAARHKEYRARVGSKASKRENSRKNNMALKLRVLLHYSKGYLQCCHCGFDDIRALQIDHGNGNGADHRREMTGDRGKGAGVHTYSWIVKNDYPEGFQVLCSNCNWIKEIERRNAKSIATL